MEIPKFDSPVITTGNNSFAIVADIDAPDHVIMPNESADFLSSFQIPNFDSIVTTARNNGFAIVADTDTKDWVIVRESAD